MELLDVGGLIKGMGAKATSQCTPSLVSRFSYLYCARHLEVCEAPAWLATFLSPRHSEQVCWLFSVPCRRGNSNLEVQILNVWTGSGLAVLVVIGSGSTLGWSRKCRFLTIRCRGAAATGSSSIWPGQRTRWSILKGTCSAYPTSNLFSRFDISQWHNKENPHLKSRYECGSLTGDENNLIV